MRKLNFDKESLKKQLNKAKETIEEITAETKVKVSEKESIEAVLREVVNGQLRKS